MQPTVLIYSKTIFSTVFVLHIGSTPNHGIIGIIGHIAPHCATFRHIAPSGLELGNEQNGKYTGAMTAADFAILHNLTLELWPDAAARPGLYGPDPHSLHDASGAQLGWIADFLDGCKKLGVPMYS